MLFQKAKWQAIFGIVNRETGLRRFQEIFDLKSIYAHMTLEDESNLIQETSDFEPNEEKESSIANQLLGMIDGVKPDIDLLLLANMTKILVLTAEAKDELHESSYEKTIDTILDKIMELIFE